MHLKVLLITNYAADEQESMQRYAQWLEARLRSAGVDVTTATPKPYAGRLVSADNALRKWLRYVDKFLIFPLRLAWIKRRNFDLLHIVDHGNAMYVRPSSRVPQLVTCHDLLAVRAALGEVPGNTVGRTGRLFQRLIRRGLLSAQHIVCVSQATQTDLYRLAPQLRSTPVVIENPLHWPYRPLSSADAWQLIRQRAPAVREPFFLHVGGNQWYKNRPGVIRIFAELQQLGGPFAEHRLVMVGKAFDAAMLSAIPAELGHRISSLTEVDNETLNALYSASDALLFPSLAEGFGWPIVEAQASGSLVITSDRAPMNQVAGPGAVLIDPEDPVGSAQRIAAQWHEREALRRAGMDNVGRFSSDAALGKYLAVYQRAIAQS